MVNNVSNQSTDVYNKKEEKNKEKKCKSDATSSSDSQEKEKMIFYIFLINKRGVLAFVLLLRIEILLMFRETCRGKVWFSLVAGGDL